MSVSNNLNCLTNDLERFTVKSIQESYLEKDIKINKQFVKDNINNKDFLDTTTSLDNIRSRLNQDKFNIFAEMIYNTSNKNNKKNLELIDSLNLKNERKFNLADVNIDNFNNYFNSIEFTAYPNGRTNLKGNLENDFFIQMENLLGSKKKKKPGILNITNLSDLALIYEYTIGYYLEDFSLSDDKTTDLIKFINAKGRAFYKYLKGEGIYINMLERLVTVNNEEFSKISIKKIKSIYSKVINKISQIKEELISYIPTISNNNEIAKELKKLILFVEEHLIRSFDNIPEVTDIVPKNFKINIWDRGNIFKSITQGTRTHCCVSANNGNVESMMSYIINKNIVLVEITDNNYVIGQAFVYLGSSIDNIYYDYLNKIHTFLVIDNIEINNNYAQYTIDIARNLKLFMRNFKDHISGDISDILLGTHYNDIIPPFSFKTNLDLKIIGQQIYTDNTGSFYKFL